MGVSVCLFGRVCVCVMACMCLFACMCVRALVRACVRAGVCEFVYV